eukprot:728668_1
MDHGPSVDIIRPPQEQVGWVPQTVITRSMLKRLSHSVSPEQLRTMFPDLDGVLNKSFTDIHVSAPAPIVTTQTSDSDQTGQSDSITVNVKPTSNDKHTGSGKHTDNDKHTD